MSEPIPESVPTSADSRSRRPVKKARLHPNASATVSQADQIEDLMWDPSRPVQLPFSTSDAKSRLAPPPEIVSNVQGSSAGAGSGEFHVYKASRRREYERLREMDEEAKKEEDNAKWEKEEQERKGKDEEKTRKNREKRNRRKIKGGKSGLSKELKNEDGGDDGQGEKTNGVKKGLKIPERERDVTHNGDTPITGDLAVAEVAQEIGITIHDDD